MLISTKYKHSGCFRQLHFKQFVWVGGSCSACVLVILSELCWIFIAASNKYGHFICFPKIYFAHFVWLGGSCSACVFIVLSQLVGSTLQFSINTSLFCVCEKYISSISSGWAGPALLVFVAFCYD